MNDRMTQLAYDYIKLRTTEEVRLMAALEFVADGQPISVDDKMVVRARAEALAQEKMQLTMTLEEWRELRTLLTRAESRIRSQRAKGRTVPAFDSGRATRQRKRRS